MSFEYQMVQLAPNVAVKGAQRGTEAATYLQGIVNEMAAHGWDFYRLDPIGVQQQPGCIGALFGQAAVTVNYYVATFRKEV